MLGEHQSCRVDGHINDALAADGYSNHALERFLVRILFCLFAEDTSIFEPNAFTVYIEQNTKDDGSDLGLHLGHFIKVLDTPKNGCAGIRVARLGKIRYIGKNVFIPLNELTKLRPCQDRKIPPTKSKTKQNDLRD